MRHEYCLLHTPPGVFKSTQKKSTFEYPRADKIESFRMIDEEKCDHGEQITAESRKKSLDEIQTLYDELREKL